MILLYVRRLKIKKDRGKTCIITRSEKQSLMPLRSRNLARSTRPRTTKAWTVFRRESYQVYKAGAGYHTYPPSLSLAPELHALALPMPNQAPADNRRTAGFAILLCVDWTARPSTW